MTKHVFADRAPVAHAWAHQTQSNARYRDNFSFEGAKLYSYRTIIAYRMRHPNRDKSHIGEPFALITSERYSVTTSRHMGAVWGATRGMERYSVPDLDSLVTNALQYLTRPYEEGKTGGLARLALQYERARKAGTYEYSREASAAFTGREGVREWLRANSPAICRDMEQEGERELFDFAALLSRMAGFTSHQFDSILALAQREKAKLAERRGKQEVARRVEEGKRIAAMSDSEFAATFPEDGTRTGADDWQAKRGADFAKHLARLHKAAKAAGLTKRTTELWRKVKLYRAHLAGRDARIIAAYRRELAAEVISWRNGGALPRNPYRFDRFAAIKRALERAGRAAVIAEGVALFEAWQAGEGKRPPLNMLEGDLLPELNRTDLADIVRADVAAERQRNESAYLAWRADRTLPRPPASAFDYSYSVNGKWNCRDGVARYEFEQGFTAEDSADRLAAHPFADAASELRKAEQAEAAAIAKAEAERKAAERMAEQAETRRAWLAGESHSYRTSGGLLSDETGGALLRINGDTLETSHGADVPLEHAIKAFRFVKLVRESGRTWQRNGKTIRVGHYQIDAIDSNGFNAGCHRINWPEIERVAIIAGVFDCPADDAAVTPSASAA
jgi:hypothetical protein